MKFIKAQQAKAYNIYKNTKLKLLRTDAATWYNKLCRTMGIQSNYITTRQYSNNKSREGTQQHQHKAQQV